MMTWRIPLLVSVMALGMLVAPSLARAGAAAPPADNEKDPPNWLVQVSYVTRQDPPARSLERVRELETQLNSLEPESAERTKLERDLKKARDDAESRSGYVVFGWHAPANEKGWPTSGGRSMSAFLLPSDSGNRRTLGDIEPGSFIVVQARGTKPVLSVSGRAYIEAKRASPSKFEADWDSHKSFEAPPRVAKASSRPTAEATLKFSSVKERESGDLLRYHLSVSAEPPADAAKASTAKVWIAMRFPTERGDVIGPAIQMIEISRGKAGDFSYSVGFDVIPRSGTKLDPTAATAEVLATAWE